MTLYMGCAKATVSVSSGYHAGFRRSLVYVLLDLFASISRIRVEELSRNSWGRVEADWPLQIIAFGSGGVALCYVVRVRPLYLRS